MLVISLFAQNDLQAIHDYSTDLWGPRQADNYIDRLTEACHHLSIQPDIGIDQSGLAPNTRSLVCESHVIYYRISGANLEILRILHARQDAARILT